MLLLIFFAGSCTSQETAAANGTTANSVQPSPTATPTPTPTPIIIPSSTSIDGSQSDLYKITAKRDLLALMMAYPEYIKEVERGKESLLYILMQSGSKIVYDDFQDKTFEQKLYEADLQDMMEQIYPLGDISELMTDLLDPGRFRVYDLLHEVYGATRSDIENNLNSVSVGNRQRMFNRNNNAAAALDSVFAEIDILLATRPELYDYVHPDSGTYNYRFIAGTSRLSPHAFAIAIDLKKHSHDYWLSSERHEGQMRLDEYPRELVRIFEDYGFIWGGKWYHFDIMHYEYRPELIIKAKYYSDYPETDRLWHYGFPDSEQTRNFIRIIDNAFK